MSFCTLRTLYGVANTVESSNCEPPGPKVELNTCSRSVVLGELPRKLSSTDPNEPGVLGSTKTADANLAPLILKLVFRTETVNEIEASESAPPGRSTKLP